MLLLVIDAELDQFERAGDSSGKRALERLVDVGAVGAHLVERGPARASRAEDARAAAPQPRNSC